MKHELKTRPQYFKVSWAGAKPFEIRKNDRGFEEHDEVVLQEYDGQYTGREIHGFITYVSSFEQKKGYVVFGIAESWRMEG